LTDNAHCSKATPMESISSPITWNIVTVDSPVLII
jgi:hypothetical protein